MSEKPTPENPPSQPAQATPGEKTPTGEVATASDAKAASPDGGATHVEPATQASAHSPAPNDPHAAGTAQPENLPVPKVDPGPVMVGERTGMFGGSMGADTSGYGGLRTPILFPGAAQRPYGGYFDDIADTLKRALDQGDGEGGASYDDTIERVVIDRGELTLHVRREHLLGFAATIRNHPGLRFEMCTGVSGVHYPHEGGSELHAVYHFISITHGSRRMRVEVSCPDNDSRIPSLVSVYPALDWHERETWDMFGIEFEGHPALTRILMPDDWPGHPQRKDYPLGGIPVEYKGGTVPSPDQRRSYN